MTPDPSQLRFFVDESSLGIGKALAIARRDVVHCGHPLIPEVPLGALDTTWMPAVAARNLIVIARDRRIRSKPAELAAMRSEGLRVLWIAGKRDMSTWDNLTLLVRRWTDIEQLLGQNVPGPWFYAVTDNKLVEIPV